MSYYPILIDLHNKKVVVAGGGAVAQRKIDTLLEYGAVVQVVSRELSPTVSKYVKEGKINLLGKEFREYHLKDAFAVIAATDDAALNHHISEAAREKGLLINAVDQPTDCNFIVPSILRRGDLLIAVSTSGKSPALAKRIREELENSFGSEYESFLRLMGQLRKEILSQRRSQAENRRIFHDLVDSDILDAMAGKDWDAVASILSSILNTKLTTDDVLTLLGTGRNASSMNMRE